MNNKTTDIYDLCIVGGGYSGLVLAVLCRRAGLLVCIVEQNKLLGKKILSTGNGRCNFTNSDFSKYPFYSSKKTNISPNYRDSIAFLNSLGVIEKDLNGYFYPFTNQAKTVRDALEAAILEEDCPVFLETIVRDIKFKENFLITTSQGVLNAKNVAIATGGLASPSLGASKLGYKTAKAFGMQVTSLAPGLVGLLSTDQILKDMAGVRSLGKCRYRDYECFGEIQFNKDGISGYPVMCISRYVGLDEIKNDIDYFFLDLIPYMTGEELSNELLSRIEKHPTFDLSQLLNGLCNDKVASALFKSLGLKSLDKGQDLLNKNKLNKLVDRLKGLKINISSTKGFDQAQVTAGGVSLDDIDLTTMESKKQTGLYFTGEVLDVDGICGGYNLEWARYSAAQAAAAVIKKSKREENDSNRPD